MRSGATDDGVAPAAGAAPGQPGEPETPWVPDSWDHWSRIDRDKRERKALEVAVRGRRAVAGLAHQEATARYRSALRRAGVRTAVLLVPVVLGWVRVLGARDAAITAGLGDRSFVPAGLVVLVVTAGVLVLLLRMWDRTFQLNPGRLELEALPDSSAARRHGAFDGTAEPPRRW